MEPSPPASSSKKEGEGAPRKRKLSPPSSSDGFVKKVNMNSSLPSNTTSPAPVSTNQTSQNGKKRKSPSQLALLHKRIRQNLITCPVAISILRDLGLRSRTTLNSGNFLAWTVDPTDPIFQTIHSYVSNGQPGTIIHPWYPRQFGIKILGILRITPGGIPPQFNDNPENRGQLRMMLWKCGRALDIRHAMKNGLKMWRAKGDATWGPGYKFQERIEEALHQSYDRRYFMEGEERTDVFRTGNVVFLFLCEVLLGNQMYLTYKREPNAPHVTPNLIVESIKCEGGWSVDPQGNQEIDDCVWPLGNGIYNRTGKRFWGTHYVVYDESRVIPKYLVKVEITDGVVNEKIC